MFESIRKLHILSILVVGVASIAGCATEADQEPNVIEEADSNLGETRQAMSTNCGSLCRADLKFNGTTKTNPPPNGFGEPPNPNFYLMFNFTNDSAVAAGPFWIKVKDANGNIVKAMHFTTGLQPHQSTSLCDVVPKVCGWKHTAILDFDGEVGESNENNNTLTYDAACITMPPNGIVVDGDIPVIRP